MYTHDWSGRGGGGIHTIGLPWLIATCQDVLEKNKLKKITCVRWESHKPNSWFITWQLASQVEKLRLVSVMSEFYVTQFLSNNKLSIGLTWLIARFTKIQQGEKITRLCVMCVSNCWILGRVGSFMRAWSIIQFYSEERERKLWTSLVSTKNCHTFV